MKDEVGAKNPRSWMMRFHTQTAGSTLTAQQPLNNVVRTAIQALAAVLGGTQSLHTNAYDEALGLPTEESAILALRTQQVIAYESGVTNTVDPLGGSYFVESLTDAIEEKAQALLDRIDAMGGAVAAIEEGWMQARIEESAYEAARRQTTGEMVVVGVNRFVTDSGSVPVLDVDPELERAQVERLRAWRESRDQAAVEKALAAVTETAAGTGNLLYPMRDALAAGATVGEVSDALRSIFGVHRPAR
jgi:methylmalonyl-CoA mutase N-terminal domain/subunit